MKTVIVSVLAVAGAAAAPALAADQKPPAKQPMPWTGVLDEEHFKALHQLKTGEVPPHVGTLVEIGKNRAYLALPKDAKPPLPAVIVIHEWWGLNQNIMNWADRLAADGYAALAVDLYDGVDAKTPDEAMAAMKKVDPARAMAALDAAYDYLGTAPAIRAKKRGVMGWCFGGGWSLQFALSKPDLDAAVMYYGRIVTDPAELKRLNAPLLGVFGNQDESIPPAKVNEFENGLREAKRTFAIYRYDAPHAFANPSNPHYDEKDAADAWAHTREWLAKYVKKP